MTTLATPDAYGVLTEPATLTVRRLLPGPIEQVWDYLTDSDLRSQWLASGPMKMKAGTSFEFVWRNDNLSAPTGKRPESASAEHRMESRIVELDPPHKIVFTWDKSGDVSIELKQEGDNVLLTLVHRRLPDRSTKLGVSAGWHAHLDILAAHLSGTTPKPFWDNWSDLRKEYDERIPA